MWGEQNRLLPKSENNPKGADLLNVKVSQLDYLFKDSVISWKLYAVDDGCPYKSGEIAENIRQQSAFAEQIQVLHLADELPSDAHPLKDLKSADDSKKGGSILLGCKQALEDGVYAIIYTDADNSVHLAPIGLLLKPYLENENRVVLGNRKGPNAVLVK